MTTNVLDPTLAAVRGEQMSRDAAEIRMLQAVVDWAAAHPGASPDRSFEERALFLAGEGAPSVAEFATYELAAALGMSSDAGTTFVGRVLEVRYRLPGIWSRVMAGEVPPWRAFKVADETRHLLERAAAYVDQSLAWKLPRLTYAQQTRTVEAALAKFEPDVAEHRRQQAAETRHFDVGLDAAGIDGTVEVRGVLDLADAVSLHIAVADAADALSDAGCEESLPVRRSMALGVLARGDQTLDLQSTLGTRPQTQPLVVHLHLRNEVAYVDDPRTPVMIGQLAGWCSTTAKIVIQPVIDLNSRLEARCYTPTPAIAEHVRLRDTTCVFPRCSRPSRSCDLDHIVPYDQGGPTSTDNLAPLCRRHHRAKTHGAWSYVMTQPGTYRWISPTGLTFDT